MTLKSQGVNIVVSCRCWHHNSALSWHAE